MKTVSTGCPLGSGRAVGLQRVLSLVVTTYCTLPSPVPRHSLGAGLVGKQLCVCWFRERLSTVLSRKENPVIQDPDFEFGFC